MTVNTYSFDAVSQWANLPAKYFETYILARLAHDGLVMAEALMTVGYASLADWIDGQISLMKDGRISPPAGVRLIAGEFIPEDRLTCCA
ncbi:hypothetical protein [Planctomycetes bacterium TBK1r]|uniref:Uncharacterized protein n=1 Tax=Stieleria magnilauensis TaxID=2527963 RepID=A0ABX5XZF3_9BACT|nr:hypothetical protein TBK1r_64480 [Planctomycetes bacterium TBK1r]